MLAVLLSLAIAGTPAPEQPGACDARQRPRPEDVQPLTPGPLKLAAVHCYVARGLRGDVPIVSPDGERVAFYNEDRNLVTMRVNGHRAVFKPHRLTFDNFTLPDDLPPLAWSAKSDFIWTVVQKRVEPNGFALTPLRPVRRSLTGDLSELPDPNGADVRVDALLFVGHEGLALTQLSMRGGMYRPERPDQQPAFAVIDARTGRIRSRLPVSALAELAKTVPAKLSTYALRAVSATVTRSGRVRVLLAFYDHWFLWTEGEAPVYFPAPYSRNAFFAVTLAPEGSAFLVASQLRAGGCPYRVAPGGPPCTLTPATGRYAALHDARTGKMRWVLEATVADAPTYSKASISDDGRFALIGLPPRNRRYEIGLVSMRSGQIVQRLPALGATIGSYPHAMGFADHGRTVWVQVGNRFASYERESH